MAFAGKTIVILGSNGIIGSGAAHAYLEAGATVIGVARDAAKLEKLKTQLPHADHFKIVEGKFDSEASAQETQKKVLDTLQGKPIDHIVSSIAFVHVTTTGPTASELSFLKHAVSEGVETTFLAAKVFLPLLKDREGSTYTLVSGGFAHMTPAPGLWAATLKNAAVNALTLGLAAETANDKVRVNNICIHIGVAEFGGDKNQLGFPAVDTKKVGPLFTALASSTSRGKVHCLTKPEEIETLAKTF